MTEGYVHGFSERERERLNDQAGTLAELLHAGTRYPAGASLLEAGCGVGAQTVILARNSPGVRITAIDRSEDSLARAREAVSAAGIGAVDFRRADVLELSAPPGGFDHVFVCFLLEHLADPPTALARLRSCLRPGGSITVIEGDHGSALFHPDGRHARRAIQALVELQARGGGDANIGRRLYPLVTAAGFRDVRVSPRLVHADPGRPAWVEGFTRCTFNAMVAGVRERVLEAGLMGAEEWRLGMAELDQAAGPEGTFCYTFFKAVGFAP